MDLYLRVDTFMLSYELVMLCKLGAFPKYFVNSICKADLWLKCVFNVTIRLTCGLVWYK